MGHHHFGILTVVEAGFRRGGEQFGGDKRVQLIMVASLPMYVIDDRAQNETEAGAVRVDEDLAYGRATCV